LQPASSSPGKVRTSLVLSFADSYATVILQLAGTVVISRLLSPAEVGVFAIAAVFSALASVVRDFGVGEYMIQERELSRDKIRAALALNILVSWSMCSALLLLAGPVAAFYREPGVADVMRVLALGFMLVPFGAITHAWFRRELDYRPIVISNVLSSIAAFIVSVAMALMGFGAMSMAWSVFAGIVAVVVATAFFRPHGFPIWPGFKGLDGVFRYSKFASLVYIVAEVGKGAPELIIGRVGGAVQVGIFSRANGIAEMLHRMLLRPVLTVCMPYFASQDREHGTIAGAYASTLALLTAVGWPFLAVMAVLAYAAIRIIYGDQWDSATPVAQILCLACAVNLLCLPSREALLACGEGRKASALQGQIASFQVLGLLAAVPYGLTGAGWGLVVAAIGGVIVSHWHLRRFRVTWSSVVRACLPSAALTLFTAGPLALAASFWPVSEQNYGRWALVGLPASLAIWLAGLYVLRHVLSTEITGFMKRLYVGLMPVRD